MPERIVRAVITGNAAGAVAAFGETAAASELAGARISKAGGVAARDSETAASKIQTGVMSKLGPLPALLSNPYVVVGAAVTAAAIGIVTVTTSMAAKYQGATLQMAAMAGITAGAAKKIGDAFLTTGGQTTFSAQKMMEAFAPVAGQLAMVEGHALNSGQALMVMRSAMDLAEATGSDLKGTTTALAQVMQAYGIGVQGAAFASDVLFNTSRALNIPVTDLVGTVDKLHAKLGPLAPSLQDVGVLLTDVATHGLTGNRALLLVSTGLNTLLGGSKATSAEVKKLGLSIFDAHGNFVGISSVIGQLAPKLENMTQQQRFAAEGALFGSKANKALDETIMAGMPAWISSAVVVSKAGTAHAAANQATSGLSGSVGKLQSAFANMGVQIGEKFQPILQALMGYFAVAANWLASVLPGALNVLGKVFSVVFAVIGTSIKVLVTIFTVEFNIVKSVIQVIVGVIQSIVGVVQHVVGGVQAAIGGITTAFKAVFGGLAAIIGAVSAPVGAAIRAVIGVAKGVVDAVIGAINTVIGWIDSIQVHIHVGPVGVDWNGLNIGKIPMLDTGGIVATAGLAYLHQAEVIVNPRQQAAAMMAQAPSTNYVTINVLSNDGRAVVNALKAYMQQNGALPLTVQAASRLGPA